MPTYKFIDGTWDQVGVSERYHIPPDWCRCDKCNFYNPIYSDDFAQFSREGECLQPYNLVEKMVLKKFPETILGGVTYEKGINETTSTL